MNIKVAAWNLQEGLALAQRAPELVEGILRRDADVVFLSDAYWLGNPQHGARAEVAGAAFDALADEGYEVSLVEYDEPDLWPEHYMGLLARVAVETETVRFGCRNAVAASVAGPDADDGLKLVGAHFDDRYELGRVAQARAVIEHLAPHEGPVALIGDLNALHADAPVAKFLGSQLVGNLAQDIPHRRAKSIAERMHEMGYGSTFRLLEAHGLRDVDPRRRSSFPSRRPFMHLDRCFVSDDVASHGFVVTPHNPASDHRAIEVVLET